MNGWESPRVREVGVRFGVGPVEGRGVWERAVEVARGVEIPVRGIVLITGASGSGKTTVVRAVEDRLRARAGFATQQALSRAGPRREGCGVGGEGRGMRCPYVRLEGIGLPRRAVVDCFGGSLEETMGLLCRAGLAEARVWMRTPGELSEGEKFRFRLARWMAGGRRVLIADEFCNGLDRVTARGVAWQLRRFVAESGRGAVVATAHEDLAGDLGAVRHVRM